MIQLLCNGVRLDVKDGAKITFKKVNPLFAFDKITCERTTEFELPDTATNNRVFSLAKIPAYRGEGMRRRFSAQMIDGGCAKNGYLYVSTFTGGSYKAIFVTGELVGLQSINSAGKMADVVVCDEVITWESGNVHLLPYNTPIWSIPSYIQEGDVPHPSTDLEKLIARVVDQNNLAPITLPTGAEGLHVIKGALNGLEAVTPSSSRAFVSAYTTNFTNYPTIDSFAINGAQSLKNLFTEVLRDVRYRIHRQNLDQSWTTTNYNGRAVHLSPKQPLKITFSSSFPSDVRIGRFAESGFYYSAFEDFGGEDEGATLAGRTIDLDAGQDFTFVKTSEYFEASELATEYWKQGWHLVNPLEVSEFTIEGGDIAVGHTIRLQDNLPDCTLVELLKTIAATTGTVLNYTDADGITFDEVDVDSWGRVDVSNKVLQVSDISRTFGDYVQKNLVYYDSVDEIPAGQKISTEYTIDNDNLDAEADLQKIPFLEGEGTPDGGFLVIKLKEQDKDALATTNTQASKMARVLLPKNAGIQSLCDASTKMVVKLRMSLLSYNSITAKTKLLLNGSEYVWTESNWSDYTATFTLAKIR